MMKLRIEKPIYGGAGLARDEGKAIFVPFTLRDEAVEARVIRDHGSYAEAELESVLEASPHRTHAPCPYFGSCGGCHYQHAEYDAQLKMKTRILRETLERGGITEIPEIDGLHGEPWGYRNRIRLQIDGPTSKLCYKKRASNENLAVDVCPITAPVLESALKAMQSAAEQWRLGKHFEEVELFTNAEQDSILMTLWSGERDAAAAQALQLLWPRMRESLPKLIGSAVFTSERGKQQGRLMAQAGEQMLTYEAAGRGYRVSVGSFFQVNRHLIGPLIEVVTAGRAGKVAWDLYAGVGLFSAALAAHFEAVVAVESAPRAVRDLRRNVEGRRYRVVGASTLEFLRSARRDPSSTPDFVVADPPRAGLGKEVTALLTEVRPGHITYVSCDPATLSRDVKSLLDSGYHLRAMRMVDLFPQTFHLESIAELSLE